MKVKKKRTKEQCKRQSIAMKGRPSGNLGHKKGVYLKCENCNSKFYVTQSRLKQTKAKGYKIRFCSHKCYNRKGKNNNQYGNSGKENHNWKGGKTKNGGYVMIYFGNGFYVSEHRLVVEQIIDRKLKTKEEIHHINFNRADNRVENLYIFMKDKHKAYHNLKNKPKLISNIYEYQT